jgi:hypothetical protein
MSGAVQSDMIRCVAHSVNRFTIEIATTPQEFRAEYERVELSNPCAAPSADLTEPRSARSYTARAICSIRVRTTHDPAIAIRDMRTSRVPEGPGRRLRRCRSPTLKATRGTL